jgi:hypothetical protein
MPRGRIGGRIGQRNTTQPTRSLANGVWGLQEAYDALYRSAWPSTNFPQSQGFNITSQPTNVTVQCDTVGDVSFTSGAIRNSQYQDPISVQWQKSLGPADTPITGNIWSAAVASSGTPHADGQGPPPILSFGLEPPATVIPTAAEGDEHYKNVLLLTPFDASFNDASLNPVAINAPGVPALSSVVRFGPLGAYFDGTAKLTYGPTPAMELNNFTIEFWIKGVGPTGHNGTPGFNALISSFGADNTFSKAGSWAVAMRRRSWPGNWWEPEEVLMFSLHSADNVRHDIFTDVNVLDNEWHHVAVVRISSSIAIYVDGQERGGIFNDGSVSGALSPAEPVAIGGHNGSNSTAVPNWRYFVGDIDGVRVSNVARYSSNFNIPTTKFPITILDDPNIASVVFLLDVDTTATPPVFIDRSSTPKPITLSTGPMALSLTQKKFGAGSAFFNGTDAYLYVPPADSPNLILTSTNDFTIEAWIYLQDELAGAAIVTERFTSSRISYAFGICGATLETPGRRLFFGSLHFGWSLLIGNADVPLNEWVHVAVTRTAATGICQLFINGSIVGSGVVSTTSLNFMTNEVYIGRRWDNATVKSFFNGHIDDLRITKNLVRYQTDFKPPKSPAGTTSATDPNFNQVSLLVPFTGSIDSTTFTDLSPTPSALTRIGDVRIQPIVGHGFFPANAAYFDGANSYLQTASAAKFNFTTDFAVEGWFRFSSPRPQQQGLIATHANADSSGWALLLNGGRIHFYAAQASNPSFWSVAIDTNVTPPENEWIHLAVTRRNNTLTVYYNGRALVVQNTAIDIAPGTTLEIGSYGYFSGFQRFSFFGHMHDVRITKNFHRYPPAFEVPTAAFKTAQKTDLAETAIKYHVNFENGINDRSGNNVISTLSSNASVTTTRRRFGTYSLTNGNISPRGDFRLSGDFTIEGWFYFAATTTKRFLYSSGTLGFGLVDFYLENGKLYFQPNGASAQTLAGEQHVMINNWHHIAFVRDTADDPTKIRCFVDNDYLGEFIYSGTLGDNEIEKNTFFSVQNGDYLDEIRITAAPRYTYFLENDPVIGPFPVSDTQHYVTVEEAGNFSVRGKYYPAYFSSTQIYNRRICYKRFDNRFCLIWSDGWWILHQADSNGEPSGRWEYFTDSFGWTPANLESEKQFITPLTSTFTLLPTLLDNGTYFRLKAESGFQTIYSSAALLTNEPLDIRFITQPKDQTAVNGIAVFTALGRGIGRTTNLEYTTGLSYQWQKQSPGSTVWDDIIGQTNASLTVSGVATPDNGSKFRVRFGCGTTNVGFSETATLTVL